MLICIYFYTCIINSIWIKIFIFVCGCFGLPWPLIRKHRRWEVKTALTIRTMQKDSAYWQCCGTLGHMTKAFPAKKFKTSTSLREHDNKRNYNSGSSSNIKIEIPQRWREGGEGEENNARTLPRKEGCTVTKTSVTPAATAKIRAAQPRYADYDSKTAAKTKERTAALTRCWYRVRECFYLVYHVWRGADRTMRRKIIQYKTHRV